MEVGEVKAESRHPAGGYLLQFRCRAAQHLHMPSVRGQVLQQEPGIPVPVQELRECRYRFLPPARRVLPCMEHDGASPEEVGRFEGPGHGILDLPGRGCPKSTGGQVHAVQVVGSMEDDRDTSGCHGLQACPGFRSGLGIEEHLEVAHDPFGTETG